MNPAGEPMTEADARPALTGQAKRDRPAAVPRTPKTTAAKPRGKKATTAAPSPETDAALKAAAPETDEEAEEREDGEAEPAGVDAEISDAAPAEEEEEDQFAEKDEDAEAPNHSAALSRSSSGPTERLDPMAAYLREVQRHPLLTPEKTHEIAAEFVKTQNPALAAQLVTANLRLVVKIAYEYRRAYKNIMDLVQEGNIGLMQAVKRYDPYRGVKLSSYAAWWIRAYILRFILNNWRLVKLGTTQAQRKLFFNLRKKRAELSSMGVDPTNAEIAKSLNVPESAGR